MLTTVFFSALLLLGVAYGDPIQPVNFVSGGMSACTLTFDPDAPIPTDIPSGIDGHTIFSFRTMCSQYSTYIDCLETNLNTSNDPTSFIFSLLFDATALRGAYDMLCSNLTMIEGNISCLSNMTFIRPCYAEYTRSVDALGSLGGQTNLSTDTIRSMACHLTMNRYNCECDIYRECNEELGQLMTDFYYSGLPAKCLAIEFEEE